jgi:Cdc6-like AAA superfamily ATPase
VITITFILVYGSDGTGKSVQCKNVAEAMEDAEHWSFATKNRKLYEQSEIQSVELLRFNPDNTVNPYQTMDAFRDKVTATVKESNLKFLVVDEITLLRKYAQPVIIEEINRNRRGSNKPPITKIGENNYAAWEQVNKLVYGRLELLANWSR